MTGESPPDGYEQDGEVVEIGNEFAFARVRKLLTPNGERLEVSSPRLGHTILLDAVELEALSWQTHDTFSRILESPGGPPSA